MGLDISVGLLYAHQSVPSGLLPCGYCKFDGKVRKNDYLLAVILRETTER